jgi:hypothetical protein
MSSLQAQLKAESTASTTTNQNLSEDLKKKNAIIRKQSAEIEKLKESLDSLNESISATQV